MMVTELAELGSLLDYLRKQCRQISIFGMKYDYEQLFDHMSRYSYSFLVIPLLRAYELMPYPATCRINVAANI